MTILSLLRSESTLDIATFIIATCICEEPWKWYIRTSDQDINNGFGLASETKVIKIDDASSLKKVFAHLESTLTDTVVLDINGSKMLPYVYRSAVLQSEYLPGYLKECHMREATPISENDAVIYFNNFLSIGRKCGFSICDEATLKCRGELEYNELLNGDCASLFQAFCCALSHQVWVLEHQDVNSFETFLCDILHRPKVFHF